MVGRTPAAADDMPVDDTHPYFPDRYWPYPIIATVIVVTLGLLAAFAQRVLLLGAPADPRISDIPRADWYFLFLHQLLQLGPPLITSILIPLLAVTGLLLWPLIDSAIGPRIARRLGWRTWPAPGRNAITMTALFAVIGAVATLTIWAMAGPTFCLPWFVNGRCAARNRFVVQSPT